MTETVEALIKRTMALEDRYYDLQAKYQELIHQHEELKVFIDYGFEAHPNLDLDIEALKERHEKANS